MRLEMVVPWPGVKCFAKTAPPAIGTGAIKATRQHGPKDQTRDARGRTVS